MAIWARLASHQLHHNTPIRYILYRGLFLSAIGHFIMVIPILQISILGRFIHEAGDSFMFIFLYYGIRKLFPVERAGGNAGAVRLVQNSSLVIGSLIFAPMGKLYGNPVPLVFASSFSLLALFIGFHYRHLIKH
jgi:hypothetical protein